MFVDVNGNIVEEAQARISVYDAGYYFGLGIYETILVTEQVPLFYDEHIDRLSKALHFLEFKQPQNLISSLPGRIKALLQKNLEADTRYRMRIMVSPGRIQLPEIRFEGLNSSILMSPVKAGVVKAHSMYLSQLPKNTGYALPSYVKLTSNHKNLVSARDAHIHGADEALLLNEQGYITEGSFSNFFFVKNDQVFTASDVNNLLSGITREKVLAICQQQGISLAVGDFTLDDLFKADEAFLTSSTRGIVSVKEILYLPGGPGILSVRSSAENSQLSKLSFQSERLTRQMQKYYQQLVDGHIKENRARWL